MTNTNKLDASLEKKAVAGALALAAVALAFLVWLLGVAVPNGDGPPWTAWLPASDACCNGASALCAILGVWYIRRGRRGTHKAFMLAALTCSALFLVGYVVFHHYHGETRFAGSGGTRVFYLCLLASHVLLSFIVLPLLFVTVTVAGLGVFERHKRLARWVFPLWLYVSLSGVAVYFFLRSSY
jgi:putative membrane protein